MNVIRFPVLTMDAIVPREWEAVLTLPLPQNPSLSLLEKARGQLLLYLEWIVTEMVLIDEPSIVQREILRVTDRLLEFASVFPYAMETYAERRLTSIPPRHMESVMKWLSRRSDGDALIRKMLDEPNPDPW